MEKLKDVKWRKKVLNIIATINIIVLFVMASSGFLVSLSFINVFILILLGNIVMPLSDELEERSLKDKDMILKIILKSIVLFTFSIAYYRIFSTKNYNLKWSYYIALVSFFIIAIDLTYIQTLEKNKKYKEEGKENNKIYLIFSVAFSIFIMVYIPYNIIERSYSPPREIDLQEIIAPDSISVHKVTGDEYRNIMDFSSEDKDVMVSSSKEIEKILQEIKTKNLKNLSLTENFNYEKMKMDNSDQYTLWFNYPDLSGKKIRLENGYIQYITITSNGKSFIGEGAFKKGLIYNEVYYIDKFKINLSEKTIDTIKSYIK